MFISARTSGRRLPVIYQWAFATLLLFFCASTASAQRTQNPDGIPIPVRIGSDITRDYPNAWLDSAHACAKLGAILGIFGSKRAGEVWDNLLGGFCHSMDVQIYTNAYRHGQWCPAIYKEEWTPSDPFQFPEDPLGPTGPFDDDPQRWKKWCQETVGGAHIPAGGGNLGFVFLRGIEDPMAACTKHVSLDVYCPKGVEHTDGLR